ncbi:MAG: hypothetical protein AAFZ58_08885 [Pseudomonadota bacterium]
MRIAIVVAGLLVIASSALGNEMFIVPPTEVVFRGHDAYGDGTYEIAAEIAYPDNNAILTVLRIAIYDKQSTVDLESIGLISAPDIGAIEIVNDIGVYGSYFYIRIPFGEVGKCRKARRSHSKPELRIKTGENGSVDEPQILDPCDGS